MGTEGPSRDTILVGLEQQAEELNAHQLDLIAQIEAHLRAVHHTMRRIGALRSARHRVGPELSNGERRMALDDLSAQIHDIEEQLKVQEETCRSMHELVRKMLNAAWALKIVAARLTCKTDEPSASA